MGNTISAASGASVRLEKLPDGVVNMGDLERVIIVKANDPDFKFLGEDVFLMVRGKWNAKELAFKLNLRIVESLILAAARGFVEVSSEEGRSKGSTKKELQEIVSEKALSL